MRRPPSIRPADPTTERQRRRIGSADHDREITIRYGGRLEVVPDTRPGGWRVTGYPRSILHLLRSPAPADSHTFTAVAVGEGQISLTAGSAPGDTVMVRVRVVRDLTQRPQP